MKTHLILIALALVGVASISQAANVFVNEIDYDQPGTDTLEFVELAGQAGLNLNGYTLEFVNGADNLVYQSIALPNFVFPDFTNTGWGFFVLGRAPMAPQYDLLVDNFIQNGTPDGIRLLSPSNSVIEFVSYEGAMPGATDVIPIADDNTNPGSISKTGPVSGINSGTWVFAAQPTPHFLNGGEDLVPVEPIPEPTALPLLLVSALLLRRRRT